VLLVLLFAQPRRRRLRNAERAVVASLVARASGDVLADARGVIDQALKARGQLRGFFGRKISHARMISGIGAPQSSAVTDAPLLMCTARETPYAATRRVTSDSPRKCPRRQRGLLYSQLQTPVVR
jgi:hypothetical protein